MGGTIPSIFSFAGIILTYHLNKNDNFEPIPKSETEVISDLVNEDVFCNSRLF